MPTTHQWAVDTSGFSGKFFGALYDPSNYVGRTPFVAGDTLDFTHGWAQAISNVAPLDGFGYGLGVGQLLVGAYNFHDLPKSASNATFDVSDEEFVKGTTVNITGANPLQWDLDRTVINSGLVQIGSATTSGSATILFSGGLISLTGVANTAGPTLGPNAPLPIIVPNGTQRPAQLINNGSITEQNGSTLTFNPDSAGATVVNAAGASIVVSSGSSATFYDSSGSTPGGSGNTNIQNAGLIAVTGVAERTTRILVGGAYSGTGTLSVQGVAGQTDPTTYTELVGPASGTFNVASGGIRFDTTPVSGSINFLDNNAGLTVNAVKGDSYGGGPKPFGAVINGFQAGDAIHIETSTVAGGHTYDPASHLLTILGTDKSVLAQFTLNGAYDPAQINVVANGAALGQAGAFETLVSTTVNSTGSAALAGDVSTVTSNGQDTVFGGAGTNTVTAAKGLAHLIQRAEVHSAS